MQESSDATPVGPVKTDYYDTDFTPVSMFDPMLSSLPLSSISSALGTPNSTSSSSSSCSSLDTMDLDVIEYQELKSSDSLSTFLTYDCDGLIDSDKSSKVQKEITVAPGLMKMLHSKSHKIILQERSWQKMPPL